MTDDDDDLPDGVYHDDDWPTVKCPYCRAEIAEGSERCPQCESYISKEDGGEPKTSFWKWMMALAIISALLFLMMS